MTREAFIATDILSNTEFDELKSYFLNHPTFRLTPFDECGRRLLGNNDPMVAKYHEALLPVAKKLFKSDTLVPTNALFVEYAQNGANLHKHYDANACTYTIDLCLYESHPWALWVDGKEYFAKENEGICFYGEEQEHWREPLNENDISIGLMFFHYVEPDHWFFTEGPQYVDVIRDEFRTKGFFNRKLAKEKNNDN